MGNQQEANCFSSKLYERKSRSETIHKVKRQRDLNVKNERIPERSRFSQQSQSLIEFPNLKDSPQPSKNSQTITIQITINLKENQQFNSAKKSVRAQIERTLASSLQSLDEFREDNCSYRKEHSTKSNTIAMSSKQKMISEALRKAEEFDKLSLPSESNFWDEE